MHVNINDSTPNPNNCGGAGQCEGGTQELGFAWAEGGVALESVMPYDGEDGPCNATVAKAGIKFKKTTMFSSSFYRLTIFCKYFCLHFSSGYQLFCSCSGYPGNFSMRVNGYVS